MSRNIEKIVAERLKALEPLPTDTAHQYIKYLLQSIQQLALEKLSKLDPNSSPRDINATVDHAIKLVLEKKMGELESEIKERQQFRERVLMLFS